MTMSEIMDWMLRVANATVGFCLVAVGFNSANRWTAAAVQFVLVGTCTLVAGGLHCHITSAFDWPHRWSGRILLLFEGVVGVASLSGALAVYFLRTGTKRDLAAEFGAGPQLDLLVQVLYNAGLSESITYSAACGCLATLNFHDVLRDHVMTTLLSRCATIVKATGVLLLYLLAAVQYCGFFGWTLQALLPGHGETFPKLLADIEAWDAPDGVPWSPWGASTDMRPVWKALFLPQMVTRVAVRDDATDWHALTLNPSPQGWSSTVVHARNDGA